MKQRLSKRTRARPKDGDKEDEQANESKKRLSDEGEDEWAERRRARADQRDAERHGRGVKRAPDEVPPEDQQDYKALVVEDEDNAEEVKDETMAPLWRSKDRASWSMQIEGGLSHRWRLRKGVALDLGTRDENNELWNFDNEDKRAVIREYVKTHKPLLVIGSHVQAVVERWGQEAAKKLDTDDAKRLREKNKEHQEFLAEIYHLQANEGRYFTHEVVKSDVVCGKAEKCIVDVLKEVNAGTIKLGEWVNESGSKGSIEFVTNNESVQKRLREVNGIIEHRFKNGDESENRYGKEGEKAILRGLIEKMRETGRLSGGIRGKTTPAEERPVANVENEYWDNISGEWLDPTMVKAARKEEMIEFEKHRVYTKVPLSECYDRTGVQPIGTRWVDVNKGDKIHPEYRSR